MGECALALPPLGGRGDGRGEIAGGGQEGDGDIPISKASDPGEGRGWRWTCGGGGDRARAMPVADAGREEESRRPFAPFFSLV